VEILLARYAALLLDLECQEVGSYTSIYMFIKSGA
jgi:hypothetical protein